VTTPISGTVRRPYRLGLLVSINFEQEVVCAPSNGYVADDLGWPLSTLNHLNFYILRCLMYLCNWRSQRLQIWCKGWMCKSQPTDDKLSLGSNHITGTDKPKVVKFCTQVGYINSSNRMTYHQQKAWLWSRDWFKMFAVCRDAARRAGLSATAYPLVEI